MKKTPPSIIALDGPAASGKSTLGLSLARALNYLFFDTGIMYRAVTYAALSRGVNLRDEAAVARLAETLPIDILPPSQADGRTSDVVIEGEDVTWKIRSREVEGGVSIVAAYAGVRKALSAQQRRIGLRGRVVMVGRDIGTVVLPEADLKIYLDASAEERARRRYKELLARGETADYEEILKKVKERDQIDSSRAVAPLRPAEDAVILNADQLNIEQTLSRALELCDSAQKKGE